MAHSDAKQQRDLISSNTASSSVLFVDGNVSSALTVSQDGSEGLPFKTIQQAIDALIDRNPLGATASELSGLVRACDRINIAPGDYDEDLFIDLTNRHLELIGRFNLGVFDQDDWLPVAPPATGPRRNINITGDVNATDSVLSSLTIASDLRLSNIANSTFTSYGGPRISGQIISTMTNSQASLGRVWTLVVEAHVFGTTGDTTGVSIDCTGDQTAPSQAIMSLSLTTAEMFGALDLGTGRFSDAFLSVINGDVSGAFFGSASQCQFKTTNFTFTDSIPFDIGVPINGFTLCRFDNAITWDSPNDLFVDFFSNGQAREAGITFAGGAAIDVTGSTLLAPP